jgi:hypothetical protein
MLNLSIMTAMENMLRFVIWEESFEIIQKVILVLVVGLGSRVRLDTKKSSVSLKIITIERINVYTKNTPNIFFEK